MRHSQRGALLLILMLTLILGAASAVLLSGERIARTQLRIRLDSAHALAQARNALIGYAISYAEQHPNQGYGYLPCPDTENAGSYQKVACAPRGHGVFGRLPYRTLGLADLRDGRGDCLWYAVAGSIKNNPKPMTFNWDSPGQFRIVDQWGQPVPVPGGKTQSAVAVIFAAGSPLNAQDRPAATDARCPGSEDVSADLPAYLDAGYPTTTPDPLSVKQGLANDEDNNDLLIWITTDDIFDALRRRVDFAPLLNGMIDRTTSAFAIAMAEPDFLVTHAGRADGNRLSGKLPAADALHIADVEADLHDNWRDQLHFVACADGSQCLRAELTAPGAAPRIENCRALVLFGGERIRLGPDAQSRVTPQQRADPAQYFEPPNSTSLGAETGDFSGNEQFAVLNPASPASADVIKCIF
ncbi:hypothetical protein J5J83_19460 [Azoarcus sp. L1K30]|uniref:hypothetical protein n=1 Tax=Azoarcus sp. L1K30 TaxID=2820277 RepID=UPI001B816E4F|nr:hypothetical protein [Azoarcus sp. L1K30]MBR0568304.1 hypothetical protein [Azoarcus sp. L1K30]